MTKTLLAAAAALLIGSAAVDAATWNFSYTFFGSTNIVTGSFDGTIQGDGNTILLTGANNDIALNGIPHSRTIGAVSAFGPATDPYATLDGTAADFALVNSGLDYGFTVTTGSDASYYDPSTFVSRADFGNGTLMVSAAVPLPAALPMLLAGLGGLVAFRRRSA